MPKREKTLRTYIYRFSGCRKGTSDAGFLLTCYYNDPIDHKLSKTSKYDNAMRYVWLRIYKPEDDTAHGYRLKWQSEMQSHGFFNDGPGWYSFVQTGPGGINSPIISGVIHCSGRREASQIASSRSSRGYTIPTKEANAMMARINLLGTARAS